MYLLHTDDDTHNGKYSDYMTAYTTSSRGDPDVHYNPSYNARYSGTYGYDDDRGVGTEQPNARLLMIFTPTSGSDADGNPLNFMTLCNLHV